MPTREDKVKINARVPKSLYDWAGSEYGSVSQAVNDGLEVMQESKACGCDTMYDNISHDPTSQNDELSHELSHELKEALDTLRGAEKNYETQQARIEDMKTQVQALYDQLHTKDDQIEKLNENMHKQAVHIQTLI